MDLKVKANQKVLLCRSMHQLTLAMSMLSAMIIESDEESFSGATVDACELVGNMCKQVVENIGNLEKG